MRLAFWKKKEKVVKKKKSVLREWFDAALFAIVAATLIRTFFVEAYTIPTGSMEGSLLINDYLFVSKMSYGPRVPNTPLAVPLVHNTMPITGGKSYIEAVQWDYHRMWGFGDVERNDVVVFNYPAGDTVAMEVQQEADYYTLVRVYGKNNEAIYSVSRGELNKKLMTVAEQHGAKIHFEHRCIKVDVPENRLYFQLEDGTEITKNAALLFGADGAFSALRAGYSHMDRVNAAHQYLEHGYKELSIPPGPDGKPMLEQNALHIWPRKNFMMIALPNTDGTFTCTLFLPFEGELSFANLGTEEKVKAFFETYFPNAVPMMPTLMEDFFNNPTSSLITTHIFPWHYKNQSALIGDAAHAIVPFYGQGMNAGFEDCTILSAVMDKYGEDWDTILKTYEAKRKPNGDAVAQLALQNFVEMRDKVADPNFLERKKIEKELGKRYPDQFVSVYEMVSFSHTPYDTAMSCIRAQDQLLQNIMSEGDFFKNTENADFNHKLDNWVSDYHQSVQQLEFSNDV